jgi:HK97 family phage portal protein
MGLFDIFRASNPTPEIVDVEAALQPFNVQYPYGVMNATTIVANPIEAMSVPSVARAKGIICSTVASLPKEQYIKSTGQHLEPNRCINQPDARISGAVVYSWLSFDIWARGAGYGVVNAVYADGRIQDWSYVAFDRVSPQFNSNMTEIIGYMIDGKAVPLSGVGSIIYFPGLDEGFFNRAGRTIRAAMYMERAVEKYAKTPVPATVLKSTGANLTAERIKALITSFNRSRQDGDTTAFLNADVDLQVLGFDPSKLQLAEARQYIALEVARAAGIPAYFLSAEPNSMTYSNAISERKSLVDFSLRPVLIAIEQRLSQPDFVPAGTVIRHDLDDFLRGDPMQRAQVYEILNRIGAMSVEQIQEEEDLINNGN